MFVKIHWERLPFPARLPVPCAHRGRGCAGRSPSPPKASTE